MAPLFAAPRRIVPTVPGLPNFTGAFVGMACQDMAGTLQPADFDYFEYHERSFRANPFSGSLG
jgi:xylan 1,4-beta-xylosidase